MLSRPPVHSLVPSLEMSIQLAPSVWPWNCLQEKNQRRWKSARFLSSPVMLPPGSVPNQSLVVKIPDGYVPVRAAGEADFRVGADGQGVTGGRR